MPHKFVIIIPSYNNIQYCRDNLLSAINQEYSDFRTIYTDDCSTDGTADEVKKIIAEFDTTHRVTLIQNTQRLNILANVYNMVHSCDDDEIIVVLDGDDQLFGNNVLTRLSQEYDKGVWLTYGQYRALSNNSIGCSQPIPNSIILGNSFRRHKWKSSHLRTYYAGLFKKIQKKDLLYNGGFFEAATDLATMFPMLEMAGPKQSFIPDVLYIYNDTSPLNNFRTKLKLQQNSEKKIRSSQRYRKINDLHEDLVDIYYRPTRAKRGIPVRQSPSFVQNKPISTTISRVYRPIRKVIV
jgi:glycosyltransferase involved in cell wall biosynthesis